MAFTTQQTAIIDEVLDGNNHLQVLARAGCGKSFTARQAVLAIAKRMPRAEVTLCAYNKAIADENKVALEKMGLVDWKRYQSTTLHSMGFSLLRFMFKPTIDDKKVRRIVEAQNGLEYQAFASHIIKLVGLAKGEGFGFFDDRAVGDTGAWYRMAEHYDINGFDETTDLDIVIEAAQHVYKLSLRQTDVIDFDDMILMPLVYNLRVRFQRDFLFVDEAQDLSRARQALARKFVKPTGKMVVIGDDKQAIYGFSGADADALANLSKQLHCKVLPLSVTFRCPKAVVRLAQTLVPDIEAADSAPEGTVDTIEWEQFVDQWIPSAKAPGGFLDHDTAILCRNTAPLISLAYSLIRNGIAAKVEGRDIGEGLKALTGRWKVKTIDSFLSRLDNYREREAQKAQAKGKDDRVEQINDKCETLVEVANACIAQGQTTVADMDRFIDNLFADGASNCVTLATYHRSKGREWLRVILFEHESRCPSKYARLPWQIEQEDNLAYVAFTRAMRELWFLI